ncbi:AAA family ATPase [Mycolicibacterium obuense]|uniref:AAA family ATPase n=1 Tax=Mycolicibacterium obuense TaxID=1807 RepID=UPI00069B72FE|nr:AAA family ATPase [Mycolicibacterium obuense]
MTRSKEQMCWDCESFACTCEKSGRRIVVTRGSSVKAKKLVWWEAGLILQYAINLLAAREGKGKSTIASSWVARETRDGGTVIWIGTEESREHAVAPRLLAAGADMDRVIFIDVETELGTGALVFPLDLRAIEKVIQEHNVTMLILDPAKAVVPSGFSGNDDIAVRQYLEPIAALADRAKVTVIGLAHFGKRQGTDSGQLMLGSVAWSQVARCVLSIADDPDTGTRVLTNTKSNYAGTDRSVEFKIVSTVIHTDDGPTEIGSVEWLGDTTLDARDFLGGSDDDDHGERTAASHWLEDYLTANGPTASKVIKSEAAKEKISEATLKRAKKKLGVVDRSSGFPRTSTWYLPSQISSEPTGVSREPTEPTEPTGLDQQKCNEPTGPDSQSAHVPTSEPTDEPTDVDADITAPTPLTTRRQELKGRRTVRFRGREIPRCLVCAKPVTAGQGDTHLGCLSKQATA